MICTVIEAVKGMLYGLFWQGLLSQKKFFLVYRISISLCVISGEPGQYSSISMRSLWAVAVCRYKKKYLPPPPHSMSLLF
jgi:hypothetical protein